MRLRDEKDEKRKEKSKRKNASKYVLDLTPPTVPVREVELGVGCRILATVGAHLSYGAGINSEYNRCHSPVELLMLALCRSFHVRADRARALLSSKASVRNTPLVLVVQGLLLVWVEGMGDRRLEALCIPSDF